MLTMLPWEVRREIFKLSLPDSGESEIIACGCGEGNDPNCCRPVCMLKVPVVSIAEQTQRLVTPLLAVNRQTRNEVLPLIRGLTISFCTAQCAEAFVRSSTSRQLDKVAHLIVWYVQIDIAQVPGQTAQNYDSTWLDGWIRDNFARFNTKTLKRYFNSFRARDMVEERKVPQGTLYYWNATVGAPKKSRYFLRPRKE